MDTLIGAVMHERFRVDEYLGGGSMADVYRGLDVVAGTPVAIKVLRPAMAQSYELVERFRREADALARLQHSNIVGQFGSGQHGDHVYIAMQFVEGDALSAEIAAAGEPMTTNRVMHIASDICSALSYLHAHGVIHRDVKPANILIERATGRAVLTDFGIARVADAATMTSFAIGTPAYMSPEQARGQSIDGRSDIYSFGCVLYEMMAGIKPFRGERSPYERSSTHAIVYEQMMQPCEPMRLYNPALTLEAEVAIARALAKSPGGRYSDANELADVLRKSMTVPGERQLRIVAPADAAVSVDGVGAGVGTCTLASVPDGDHTVTASAPGCLPFSVSVDLPRTEVVFVNMEREDGAPLGQTVTSSRRRAAPSDRPPATPPRGGNALRPAPLVVASGAPPLPFEPASLPMQSFSMASEQRIGIVPPGGRARRGRGDDGTRPPPGAGTTGGSEDGRRWVWFIAAAMAVTAAASVATAAVWWFVPADDPPPPPPPTKTITAAVTTPAGTPSSTNTPVNPPTPTSTAVLPLSPPVAPLGERRVMSGIVANLEGDICQNLRPTPSKVLPQITCVLEDKRVTMIDDRVVSAEGYNWRHVQFEDKQGWMADRYLELSTGTTPVGKSDSGNSATLIVAALDAQPDGTILLIMAFRNDTDGAIKWSSDTGDPNIYLTDSLGRRWDSIEAGSNFGRDVAGNLGPRVTIGGWHRFNNVDRRYRGPLTLHYPLHGDITFDLSLP